MLTYNTRLKRLILPEYGRNIQMMVDHCLMIEDRDERTRCAFAIIKAMGNLFPELRDGNDSKKLWDHLAIMSDFNLDIDFPVEIIRPDNLNSLPDKVPYHSEFIRYRHYGKALERLIDRAVAMPEGPERDALVDYIANHMKKILLLVNPDGVDDAKVFKDLADYSHGAILLDPQTHHLREFRHLPAPSKKKKKK